jgi:Glycosyl hydrolase family 115/Gylcosyl hydrolase family 115 C-terminal domain
MIRAAFISFLFFILSVAAGSQPVSLNISTLKRSGSFTISSGRSSAHMLISDKDDPGVIRAFKDLQADIKTVTGNLPVMLINKKGSYTDVIIAGTIGKSPLIDNLVKRNKIGIDDISGKWESFIIQVVDKPFPGVERGLVIAGSDKRGTIYGIYEISGEIGVSPWYWWADVPARKNKDLFVSPGRFVYGEPSVKYRGIFLNDEAPDLTNWVAWKYGMVPVSAKPPVPPGVANYGHEFYSRIFELLLRLKANYLWPAMWNNAFNEDDSLNAALANEYGIVMGTSHQEPMLRAQKEWDRRYLKTLGSWNWTKDSDTLVKFWREGIRRNRSFESLITIGLRGADDTEMGPGGPRANIDKLEKIVNVQRKILSEELNPDLTKTPQLWCLYKEVQDYYNAGMRVPDDVSLLWAEDNWGNLRRVPTAEERSRKGGAGIYYHFDYHGGPRSYQWINTNPIPKIWDQMALAKQYGADRIWIVNVGHFRGYEFPIEYFLSLAWNTKAHTPSDMKGFTERWAKRTFGPVNTEEIADIISKTTKYNGRRKPELLSPSTYSLVNYREAEKVVTDFRALTEKAEQINNLLPSEMQDSFYQLVLFPVKASSIVNELYYTAGRNALYARQGRAATNEMADKTELLFRTDTSLMGYYNHKYAGGKWNHFMDQTHLGYKSWVDPRVNSLDAVHLYRIQVRDTADMGISLEGSENVWPGTDEPAVLPPYDIFNRQDRYLEIFNKGSKSFSFSITCDQPWILLQDTAGTISTEKRIFVNIDWDKLPAGIQSGIIVIRGNGKEVKVSLTVYNPEEAGIIKGFDEADGYVAMEAEHYTSIINTKDRKWEKIEDYGRTLSGMRATTVTDAPPAIPGENAPRLEYGMNLFSSGEAGIRLIMSPTLNFLPDRDIKIGVSVDEEYPRVVVVVPKDFSAMNGNKDWEQTVMDNARFVNLKQIFKTSGYHTLKIWMIDPGVVIEKIVVNMGGVRESYLGPPESKH